MKFVPRAPALSRESVVEILKAPHDLNHFCVYNIDNCLERPTQYPQTIMNSRNTFQIKVLQRLRHRYVGSVVMQRRRLTCRAIVTSTDTLIRSSESD